MSRSEDFLSRWSRRKQQAAKEAALPEKEPETKAADQATEGAQSEPAATAGAAQSEPMLDLSKLPSLDSIGPNTDVSLFMQPGVPAPLARAALRRAWSADPAIRDFIGLCENSWDFTRPDSVAGFGPLLPVDDVKRLLAQVFPETNEPATELDSAQSYASQHTSCEGADTERPPEVLAEPKELVSETAAAAMPEPATPQCTKNTLATQQVASLDAPLPEPFRRRHGGALPS